MSMKRHLILWVANRPPPTAASFEEAPFDQCEIIAVQDAELARQFLKAHTCSVVCAESSYGLDFFKSVQDMNPPPVQILLLNSEDNTVSDILNYSSIFEIVIDQNDSLALSRSMRSALAQADLNSNQLSLRRESRSQNRELEALNISLEKIVEDRTAHIQVAKTEEDQKLNKVRSLIRFIKEIGSVSLFEDLLQVLRKELRREMRGLTKIGDPILVLQMQPESSLLYSFQGGNFVKSTSSSLPDLSSDLTLDSKPIKTFLANHFGRPFVRTTVIPLEIKSRQVSSVQPLATKAKGFICIENANTALDSQTLVDFFSDCLKPFSMAIDRILLENEHAETVYRWEKTFDSLQSPIAIIDIDHEVLRANRAYSERLARKKCFDSFAARTSPCEGCPIELALQSGAPQSGTIQRAGQVFEVQSYPINLESGRPTNVVNHYVDITESRGLYIRMLQAEKMGALGLLAGNIAHELNNPLTGLRSLAQVLLHEVPVSDPMHSDLQEVERAAARSQKIIKNLRDFSSKEKIDKEIISLDEVIERTMPMLKTILRSHRLELELETKQYLIQAESQMLQQVVFNLINNACQAMKNAGILRISTSFDSKKSSVVLRVVDTGPGIPVELQKKVFEAFYTTKGEGTGTGLGLSLSKEIIESHKGSIELISSLGVGTEFCVSIPIYKEEAAR